MNNAKRKTVRAFLLACSLVAFTASDVDAKLTPKQARTAITRMMGFELQSGAVRVKNISETNATEAQVAAEIRAVFKFAQDQQGKWRVAEIRTGQDRWEDVAIIAKALGSEIDANGCAAPDPPGRGSMAVDPSVKRTRCLLGDLLGVETPSDAVRVQTISPMAVPLASQASATVLAWIKVEARLLNEKAGWRVSELRTGNGNWVKLEPLVSLMTQEKQNIARAEMETMARALEKFRKDRGFYVVSDSQAVAIDHLSPRYLSPIIRVDPWHQPYRYQGERDRFTLRSLGADGKENTADDIVLNQPR